MRQIIMNRIITGNALLCTYIKEGADFRSGNYANREAFSLNGNK